MLNHFSAIFASLGRWIFILLLIALTSGAITNVSFLDEILFCISLIWLFFTLINRSSFSGYRNVLTSLIYLGVSLVISLAVASIYDKDIHTTFSGFWQLWRGQIAIIIGLLLVSHGRHTSDKIILPFLWINVIFTLLQLFLGATIMGAVEIRSGIPRTVGFFGNPNTNAFFLSLLILHIWIHILAISRSKLIWLSLSIVFFALITTASRTVILALPPLMIILWWRMRNTEISMRLKYWQLTVIFFSIISVMIVLASREGESSSGGYSLVPDMEVLSKSDDLSTAYFRTYATIRAVRRYFDNPIVGLGYGQYGTPISFANKSKYLIDDDIPVNQLNMTQLDVLIPVVLAEAGSIGLFLWFYVLWKTWLVAQQLTARRHHGIEIFWAWISILLIATISGPGLSHPVVAAIFPFLISWLLGKKK